jgi:hypothetical protein
MTVRPEEDHMRKRYSTAAVIGVAAVLLTFTGAAAFDEAKYLDWGGQWKRPRGVGTQWDQTRPSGLSQQAPLTPEYQAILETSIKDQATAGRAPTATSPASPTVCRGS